MHGARHSLRRGGLFFSCSHSVGSLAAQMGGKTSTMRVVAIGLDGAGKSSIINKANGVSTMAQPTVGFNVESVRYAKMDFAVNDVSGAGTTRALWRHQYKDVEAVVYVVDAANRERVKEATNELEQALKEMELKGKILLIYANKQDAQVRGRPREAPPCVCVCVCGGGGERGPE